MRAATLWQPWATLVVVGAKSPENRPGPFPSTVDLPATIGVHAGKTVDTAAMRDAQVLDALEEAGWGYDPLPTGTLLGSVTVTGCHNDLDDAGDELEAFEVPCQENPDGPHCDHWVYDMEPCCRCGQLALCSPWAEFDGGGIWHWELTDAVALDEPVPMRGHQGLWTVDDDVAEQLLSKVAA